MKKHHMLSGNIVATDIPSNHAQLKVKRNELEHEYLACKKRIEQGASGGQRFRLNQEMSRIKTEIALINARLVQFEETRNPGKIGKGRPPSSPVNKLKQKMAKRQQQLARLGFERFPSGDSYQAKFEWTLSCLNLALGLINGENKSSYTNEELIEALGAGFSYAIKSEELEKEEQAMANKLINLGE